MTNIYKCNIVNIIYIQICIQPQINILKDMGVLLDLIVLIVNNSTLWMS